MDGSDEEDAASKADDLLGDPQRGDDLYLYGAVQCLGLLTHPGLECSCAEGKCQSWLPEHHDIKWVL